MPQSEQTLSEARAARLARSAWNQAADVWEDFVETRKDYSRILVHGPALMRVLGPVKGLRVLDVGCGQGFFTRRLAARGASVVGMDWSTGMIERARARKHAGAERIEYRVVDARRIGRSWPAGSFDRVVACMSFMDAPGLDRILRGIHRVLRPDGRLVFSITHPINSSRFSRWRSDKVGSHGPRIIDGYFFEGPTPMHWRMPRLKRPFSVPHWHFTLESWFRKLHRAGFRVDGLSEPRPTARQARKHPSLEGPTRIPFWLVVNAEKRALGYPGTNTGRSPR